MPEEVLPPPPPAVIVRTEITYPGRRPSVRIHDWADRKAIKRFADAARKCLLAGGRVVSEAVPQ